MTNITETKPHPRRHIARWVFGGIVLLIIASNMGSHDDKQSTSQNWTSSSTDSASMTEARQWAREQLPTFKLLQSVYEDMSSNCGGSPSQIASCYQSGIVGIRKLDEVKQFYAAHPAPACLAPTMGKVNQAIDRTYSALNMMKRGVDTMNGNLVGQAADLMSTVPPLMRSALDSFANDAASC